MNIQIDYNTREAKVILPREFGCHIIKYNEERNFSNSVTFRYDSNYPDKCVIEFQFEDLSTIWPLLEILNDISKNKVPDGSDAIVPENYFIPSVEFRKMSDAFCVTIRLSDPRAKYNILRRSQFLEESPNTLVHYFQYLPSAYGETIDILSNAVYDEDRAELSNAMRNPSNNQSIIPIPRSLWQKVYNAKFWKHSDRFRSIYRSPIICPNCLKELKNYDELLNCCQPKQS